MRPLPDVRPLPLDFQGSTATSKIIFFSLYTLHNLRYSVVATEKKKKSITHILVLWSNSANPDHFTAMESIERNTFLAKQMDFIQFSKLFLSTYFNVGKQAAPEGI